MKRKKLTKQQTVAREPIREQWQGSPRDWIRSKHGIAALVVFLVAAGLILANLGNQCLWQDEAQTALVARTILSHGTPQGFDGKNYFSQESGAEYAGHGNYLWRWHTWLQFYVIVPFIAVLGSTTLAARLPFALFGLGCVILIYFLAFEMWRSLKSGLYASILLALSVPFLLLVRQCRYYSPAIFFTMLTMFFYLRMMKGKKRAWMWFVISGILLFHTFYVYCATVLAAIFVHSIIFHRDKIKQMLTSCGVVLLVNIWPIIWYAGMSYGSQYSERHTGAYLWMFILQIARHIFTPYLLIIPAALLIWQVARTGSRPTFDRETTSNAILVLLISVFITVPLAASCPLPFFRYLAPIVPLGVLLIACMLDRVHVGMAVAILAILVLWNPYQRLSPGVSEDRFYGILAYWRQMTDSTADTAGASSRYFSAIDPNDIVTYLIELFSDYRGPIDGAVKFLNDRAKKTDVVAVTYEDLPLKYYTPLRVVGGLTGEDMKAGLNAEWIVMRRNIPSEQAQPAIDMVNELLNSRNYTPIEVKSQPGNAGYPDIPFENRETVEDHYPVTVKIGGNVQPLVIFQRILPKGG